MLNNLSQKIIQHVNLFHSYHSALSAIDKLFHLNVPVVVAFINAHAYNLCFKNSDFTNALFNSDILLRDGVGMEILFKSIGVKPGINLNGTDFIPQIIGHFKGKRLALFGTSKEYLEAAANNLLLNGHNIVAICDGFCTTEEYFEVFDKSHPEILILGMGMPKQEILADILKQHAKGNCMIISGGAILDFWGKKFRRAPLWVRNMKIEWLYRFVLEPKRLFSRYMIGNVSFIRKTHSLRKTRR